MNYIKMSQAFHNCSSLVPASAISFWIAYNILVGITNCCLEFLNSIISLPVYIVMDIFLDRDALSHRIIETVFGLVCPVSSKDPISLLRIIETYAVSHYILCSGIVFHENYAHFRMASETTLK